MTEEEGDIFFSPEPPGRIFADGNIVHVFEGTGVGKRVGGMSVGLVKWLVGRGMPIWC
jgi:hypothetical protein